LIFLLGPEALSQNIFSNKQYALARGITLLREIIFRQEDLLKDISSLKGNPDQKGSLLERKPCPEIFCIFAKDLSLLPTPFPISRADKSLSSNPLKL
jgi:hypothetical protein